MSKYQDYRTYFDSTSSPHATSVQRRVGQKLSVQIKHILAGKAVALSQLKQF